MSLALPPAPAPARPRMLLVATALASAAVGMLFAGMLGVWIALRDAAGGTSTAWLPKGVEMPGVAANMMLIIMAGASVMVQWSVYAMARDNRRDAVVAAALTVIFGIAVFNAQAYIYQQIGVPVATRYGALFYSVTGAFLVALVAGMIMAVIVVFRSLGGRYSSKRHEGISALALYWHFLTATFAAVWFVVYVVK
jgi:cytochrome c oxidase subunit III